MDNGAMMQGRWVCLRSLRDHEDMPVLFEWRNNVDTLSLWSLARNVVSEHQFEDEWAHRMREHFHCFAMIEKREHEDATAVGFCYAYDASIADGHAFLCTYLDPARGRRGYGVEATALFVEYLFAFYPFRKLYADVFGYNTLSLRTCQHAGFEVEGVFREHRYFNARYWDVHRCALHRSQWEARRPRLLRRRPARTDDAAQGERLEWPQDTIANVAPIDDVLIGNTAPTATEPNLVPS